MSFASLHFASRHGPTHQPRHGEKDRLCPQDLRSALFGPGRIHSGIVPLVVVTVRDALNRRR